ncbi:hypothetical protein [Undibacterium sp. Tian12W]|uniref:hypothetical protein n=1 Tax=Undibacterium sp. Tian12W TaxID=3413054 RepID=UPI003BF1E710
MRVITMSQSHLPELPTLEKICAVHNAYMRRIAMRPTVMALIRSISILQGAPCAPAQFLINIDARHLLLRTAHPVHPDLCLQSFLKIFKKKCK